MLLSHKIGVVLTSTLVSMATAESAALDSLVRAERAFSALSVEKGMKEAFLSNLADDAVIFRPGPVNGLQTWRARTNPAGTLIWEPSFAEVAASGDFGVTTGPWEFRPPAGDDRATAHGHFVSVWKREDESPWKVALDIGISHPRPERGLGEVKLSTGPRHMLPKPDQSRRGGLSVGGGVFSGGFGFGLGTGATERDYEFRRTAHEVHTLMSAERSLAWTIRAKGVRQAYEKHAAEDLRFYREATAPSLGIETAVAALEPRGRDVDWTARGDAVSRSWDLGYSYGLLITGAKRAARRDTSAYTHIWRKDQAGRWKLMLDIENQVSKR